MVEANDGVAPLRLDESAECPVLVLLDGTPAAWMQLPGPGMAGPGFVGEVVVRSAEWLHDRRRVERSMRRRLGAPTPSDEEPTVSLVVSTSRRPDQVERLLRALERLDPAPLEVIVVDNNPGDADCEAVALAAGVRYIREERPGLDRARCIGARAARGDVVGFVDDDCEPPSTWLAELGRAFAKPGVTAVTGPALPAALRTADARSFEEVASMTRGLEPRLLDWTTLQPWGSVHAGVGANMFFRRDALATPEELFPPELDMGTATRSGGDTYAFYRILADGKRIAYEPDIWVFHHHRQDAAAARRAVRGYGTGVSAYVTKLLVERGELGAARLWPWFLSRYLRALGGNLAGEGDRGLLAMRWEYLRGAISGPRAWRRAKRKALEAGVPPPLEPAPERPGVDLEKRPRPTRPEVSVIVLTGGRRPAVSRCLTALAAQSISRDRYEVILAIDAEPASLTLAHAGVDEVVWGGGRGAAASRNAGVARATGELLLLLDDDTVPAPDLLERHMEAHGENPPDGGRRVVVGRAEPRPASATLATKLVALWWHDHFARKQDAATLTFTDLLTLNLSLPRALWNELGGLNEDFIWRREDWELGLRLLDNGAELLYEPAALADHELTVATRDRLAGAFMEGRGDAMLVAGRPETTASLPPRRVRRGEWPRRRDPVLVAALSRSERARRASLSVLALYERLHARRAWLNLFRVAQRGAYEAGRREGEALAGSLRSAPPRPLEIDLAEEGPLPTPQGIAPAVRVELAGRPVARLLQPDGQWSGSLAREIALRARDLRLGGIDGGPLVRDGEDDPLPLSDTAVLLGPAHRGTPDRDRAALESAGARVDQRTGVAATHWVVIDAAIREASEPVIGVPLPGVTAGPEWLRAARRPLDGERVALVIGSAAPVGRRRAPTRLLRHDPHNQLSWMWGEPEQFLVLRRDAYLALGGFDLSTIWAGPYGPLLDLVERALQVGWLVARGEAEGVRPSVRKGTARRRAQWRRWYARGALMSRRAADIGAAPGARLLFRSGASPIAARLVATVIKRQPGARHLAGVSAAFAAGAVAQARRAARS